jgi:hypothetical protein
MVQSFRFFNKMLILVSLITLLLGCSQEKVVTYDLGTFQMGINSQGEIVELKDGIAEKDYLLSDETSYLISLKIDTVVYHPTKATFSDEGRTIEFDFIKGRKLTVRAVAKDKYFTFEVEAIRMTKIWRRSSGAPITPLLMKASAKRWALFRMKPLHSVYKH